MPQRLFTIIHAYFLPIWFEAVRGDDAIVSGVHLIPYVVAMSIFSAIAGVSVTKTGFFNPPTLLGPIIGIIGCSMLTTLTNSTTTVQWIGYEILAGAGVGIANQQGYIAIQTYLPLSQTSIGTSLVLFT